MKISSVDEIPKRATLRTEYVKHGDKLYGPYSYKYWKENGMLKKVYVGKSKRHLEGRLAYKAKQKELGKPVAQLLRGNIRSDVRALRRSRSKKIP
jgi:hypothetical protein